MSERTAAGVALHGPKARRAAWTAASTSAFPAADTVASGWPFEGSIVVKRAPPSASTRRPSMRNR